MREAHKGRAKRTIKNCNFIQHKHLTNLLLKDGAHRTHTRTHKESDQIVFNWIPSQEDSRAEDQGSWLPGRERAAGRPFLPGAPVTEGRTSAAEPS